uniref:Uncharacterized protein n=1 Tax=Meloidogyne incognita TaxID=6306 RepID=A0A914MCJ7_MELIC
MCIPVHTRDVPGPVTELLLVETNRCYVQLISIYNSTVVNARILGICERPGALCVDNYGNVLIFDRSSSSVGLYSRAFLGIIIRYY